MSAAWASSCGAWFVHAIAMASLRCYPQLCTEHAVHSYEMAEKVLTAMDGFISSCPDGPTCKSYWAKTHKGTGISGLCNSGSGFQCDPESEKATTTSSNLSSCMPDPHMSLPREAMELQRTPRHSECEISRSTGSTANRRHPQHFPREFTSGA